MTPLVRAARMHTGIARGVRAAMSVWALGGVAACASAAGPRPQTQTKIDFATPTPRVETPPANGPASAVGATALPQLAPADALIARPYAPPISLDYDRQDIGTVLRDLSKSYGLSLVVDPAVRGPVTIHATGLTLDQALHEIVGPAGFAYQLLGPTLVVTPVQLEHKDFTFNYVAMTRIAAGNTSVQRELSGGVGGTSAGTVGGLSTAAPGVGGNAGGGDIIQGYSDADIWKEVQSALDVLLFPATPAVAGAPLTTPAAQTPQNGVAGSVGTPAFSRSTADGTSLIISPVGGLISVTATPEKIAQV
ncbi:MAG TPA: hypothetical protein VMH39_16195, partial [Gemmatimonadaceae bacterium]|nr:hypothetical protein [Gemmatimonadaceae bacterium]